MNKTPKKMGRPTLPPHLVKSCRSFSFTKSQHEFITANGGNAYIRKLVASDMALRGGDSDA
jgi:hypothetical protein